MLENLLSINGRLGGLGNFAIEYEVGVSPRSMRLVDIAIFPHLSDRTFCPVKGKVCTDSLIEVNQR